MTDAQNTPATILVIEDDAGDFGLVKAFLRQAGVTATGQMQDLQWAKTLAEGLALVQHSAPDLVLLDLSLPDSSGLPTLHALRQALAHTPIVVLTGNDAQAQAQAALESGAQDYLVKGSFDPDALGRAIRHAMVRQRLEQHLAHSQQLYAALSQCNQAIVRCRSEAELLAQVCRIAVEFGGLKMAWIGRVQRSTLAVQVQASFGSGTDYLDDLDVSVDASRPSGCGPSGTAFRQQQPVWCQDFLHDPQLAPWQARATHYGWRSVAVLPLWRQGAVVGLFSLYAGELHAFDSAARKLLQEMASDISFALDNFDREAERAQTQALIVQERDFTQAALDSLPGLFYLIDAQGRLLRWNQTFERVSGYSAPELASMSALDFFGAADRGPVAAAMAQTYRTGETLVEAEFVAKDTSSTPYLFSGRRFMQQQQPCLMGLAIDITQRRQANARLEWLSHFDPLTGLANLSLLGDRFHLAMNMAQRSQRALTLMLLDLDHFKNINDSLGRATGDALLVQVARRIESLVRAEDTVSRQGGDEFVLLLPTTDAAGAAHLAERLLASIASAYQIDALELLTTPSIGIAMYPADGLDFDTLSKNADIAMYRAKHDGRNCYRFFAAEMQVRSTRVLMLENALRRAIERGQLSLHFQPQVALADGRVVGAEALLRWNHPEFGPVPPAEFIPIAEASGQIVQIGEWVLRSALRQMQALLAQGLAARGAPFVMAVNLSVVQFRHPRLVELVLQILQEEQIDPQHLELELTEGVALSDPIGAITVMDALHARGIRMSIDDFGTGYSSLSHLKRFKVYKLKIDQSFVRDITHDPDDRAIVSTIIGMAARLGLQTIAEGVETPGQLDFLRTSGCAEGQGYLFSKPLPAAAFEAFLRQPPARP